MASCWSGCCVLSRPVELLPNLALRQRLGIWCPACCCTPYSTVSLQRSGVRCLLSVSLAIIAARACILGQAAKLIAARLCSRSAHTRVCSSVRRSVRCWHRQEACQQPCQAACRSRSSRRRLVALGEQGSSAPQRKNPGPAGPSHLLAAPLPAPPRCCGCAGFIGPTRMIGKALSPFGPPTILLAVALFSSLLFCTSIPPFLDPTLFFDVFLFPHRQRTSFFSDRLLLVKRPTRGFRPLPAAVFFHLSYLGVLCSASLSAAFFQLYYSLVSSLLVVVIVVVCVSLSRSSISSSRGSCLELPLPSLLLSRSTNLSIRILHERRDSCCTLLASSISSSSSSCANFFLPCRLSSVAQFVA